MAEESNDVDESTTDEPDEGGLEEVETSMSEGGIEVDEEIDDSRQKPLIDSDGRFYGTGRRKESVARVWIESGSGSVTVNESPMEDYFNSRAKWTKAAIAPLTTVDFEDDVDVWANVKGGGLTGQADAIKLGVARALVEMDENARTWLRSAGHLTRDDREVERKKINQPGARAKQQVSKR